MKTIFGSVLLCTLTAIGQVQIGSTVAAGFNSAERPTTEQELAQYTILVVSTQEDLEDYLSEGYPTREIQIILNDESIPEEDRYWLDCRMRSAIAQLLHRFYDEQGNIVEVEAGWIKPGEGYWQETMMINPPGRSQPNVPTGPHCPIESGSLMDLYGEEVATLATIGDLIKFSRDGSLAITQTGYRSRAGYQGGEMHFCFMYPDGSFKEVEFSDRNLHCDRTYAVSQDGSITAWNVYNIRDEEESYLLMYDADGNEIEAYKLPFQYVIYITISPDNRYVACSAHGGDGSCVIDRDTGIVHWFSSGSARQPVFSANSKFCILPEGWLEGNSIIVDLENDCYSRLSIEKSAASPAGRIGNVSISNDGQITVVSGGVYFNGENLLSLPDYRWSSLSPNGYFCLSSTHTNARGVGVSQILLDFHSLLGGA